VSGHLSVEVSQVAVVTLRGEVDMSGVGDLRHAIAPVLAPGQTVVMDLSEVTFADSTLLNVLAEARRELASAGGALLVRNPSETARRILTIGQLDDLVQREVDRQNDSPA
jgi:stage II sporulation protein AA (anti-sigma F factor antagonist)